MVVVVILIIIGGLIYYNVQKNKSAAAPSPGKPDYTPLSPNAAMRVSMEIVEKRITPHIAGFSSQMFADMTQIGKVPVHVLVAQVTFSEESKAIIKKLKLKDDVLIAAPMIPSKSMARYYANEGKSRPQNGVYLSRFLKGETVEIPYDDIFAAQAGMDELKKNLERLKRLFKTADKPTRKTVEI